MGCFDSVNFFCPKCQKIIEVQSKAGNCSMLTFSSIEVPLDIAHDIIDTLVYCDNCKNSFQIHSPFNIKTIPLSLK